MKRGEDGVVVVLHGWTRAKLYDASPFWQAQLGAG